MELTCPSCSNSFVFEWTITLKPNNENLDLVEFHFHCPFCRHPFNMGKNFAEERLKKKEPIVPIENEEPDEKPFYAG